MRPRSAKFGWSLRTALARATHRFTSLFGAGSSRGLPQALTLWTFFFGILALLHFPVLTLPYFWDELGQFVPAALDIYEHGWWVPRSTLPNVHPPGVMAYLAGIWHLVGYSITATRVAMLGMAAAGVLGTYYLARQLSAPSWAAAVFLIASPLFWAQSMMAQLDMPAMVFTVWALVLFFREQHLACASVCTLLVLMKETSLVVPAVFGAAMIWRGRWTASALYVLPAIAIAGWLAVLKSATGHVFGNQEFTHYNLWFQLHPVRLALTVIRRLYYLFVDNFHWIGTAALFVTLRRSGWVRDPKWIIIAWVIALQTLGVTILGGAALERYLLPVLPLFYIAVSAALDRIRPTVRRAATGVLTAGLVAGTFLSSPFPYPFENNIAYVHFVRLQQQAAAYVEARAPDATVASAWPFPDALRNPAFGFVSRPMKVIGLHNFDLDVVASGAPKADVLVVYSRTWEPAWGVLRLPFVHNLLSDYYFYKPQITSKELTHLGFDLVKRWERGLQWIEVYDRRR